MNAIAYLQTQIESMRYMLNAALKSLSDDQLSWAPPGSLSSIGVIWLHMIAAEDSYISILSKQDKLWETEGWNVTFGLEQYPNIGEDWDAYEQAELTVADLQAYTQAVHQHTDAHLAAITDDVLDEKIKFFTESDPKAALWALLVTHALQHTGEIVAIKGMQGGKGLPF
jgi:uncharacterized damage-inducible protein DinB